VRTDSIATAIRSAEQQVQLGANKVCEMSKPVHRLRVRSAAYQSNGRLAKSQLNV